MNTTNAPLQYASVCSGIESVSLAWQPLGMVPVWFSEIDSFACALLKHHYPAVPNLGDMTQIETMVRAGSAPAPDILAGGTPCQSFSNAGGRQGMSDPRGALSLRYVELANAIDHTRRQSGKPSATIVWENVPGVLNDRRNAFGSLLGALAAEGRALEPPGSKWTHAGCVSGPRRRIAWRLLDAQYFGLAQRRRRVFLVASGRDGIDPAAVLFECDGLHRNTAPGNGPRQDTAAAAAACARAPGGNDRTQHCACARRSIAFGGGNTSGPIAVAACLLAAAGARGDYEVETFMVQPGGDCIDYIGHPPEATCTPQAMAFAQNSRGELRLESGHGQVTGTMTTGGGMPGQGRLMIASAPPRDCAHGPAGRPNDRISPTLRACSGAGDMGHVLAHANSSDSHRAPGEPDWSQWRIRRLMPMECERLQGMPEGYTLVPYRGRPAADAPRYKAIGNAMAVPCLAWLGRRLLDALNKSR